MCDDGKKVLPCSSSAKARTSSERVVADSRESAPYCLKLICNQIRSVVAAGQLVAPFIAELWRPAKRSPIPI